MKNHDKPVPKILYKAFYVGVARGSGGALIGPHSAKRIVNEKGQPLTLKNWKGFTAKRLKGPLRMCRYGYHAANLHWFNVKTLKALKGRFKPSEVLFAVELHEVEPLDKDGLGLNFWYQGESGKWVGRSFTIKRRIK